MKIQDAFFLISLVILFFLKKPILFVWAGLTSLVLTIPLFSRWIFFTAERLTWYAAAFFLIFVIASLIPANKVK